MDVFDLRQRVIGEYADYVRSFFTIRDERIRARVDAALAEGHLWPDPLLQLSPAFEPGESIEELISGGELHPETKKIFARKREDGTIREPLRLHRHQVDGVRAALAGDSYVLTTGTGSGKSLSYIAPIVDHALRHPKRGSIKAIVVYPMNALANSQLVELGKYLRLGYPKDQLPVTFERYTGQESDEKRREIIANPPDILLTNYVMLELLLTRPFDAQLIRQAEDLRFLVFDELHTYRGRQGADVGLLVRRVREACGRSDLIHVGTSATLASTGTWEVQQRAVAEVASTIFGVPVRPDRVIGETLRRASRARDLGDPAFVAELRDAVANGDLPPDGNRDSFLAHPIASWIESTIGVTEDPSSGRLVRSAPLTLTRATELLEGTTGAPHERCVEALRRGLLTKDDQDKPIFAFRLHQFISRGDAVYASPEPEAARFITLRPQRFVPDSNRSRALLPLAFCRECGQEYYSVRRRVGNDDRVTFEPRELGDRFEVDGAEPGYLYISEADPWPTDPAAVIARLPDTWLEQNRRGVTVVKRSARERVPRPITLSADGVEGGGDIQAAYFPAPFLFCVQCDITYGAHQTSDFGKLATLGSEGRSTATTLLGLSTVRRLRRDATLQPEARKLLSFTDNRQDASLQAGHFNDFVEIGLLRSALLRAVMDAGPDGLMHDQLARGVFRQLSLPLEAYALNPAVEYAQREQTDRALREVLAYYLYRDLRRGWRITSPNLEQAGLLDIDYVSLEPFSGDHRWSTAHPALAQATPAQRELICRVLLDFMRRELAIRVSSLNEEEQESVRMLSNQHLIAPWSLDEQERLERSTIVFPTSRSGDEDDDDDEQGEARSRRRRSAVQPFSVFISPRGGFGRLLKRTGVLPGGEALTTDDVAQILRDLLRLLEQPAGLVQAVEPAHGRGVPGYQLVASGLVWRAGTGESATHDPIRVPNPPASGLRANPFFAQFYRQDTSDLRQLRAREHTAQVPSVMREEREEAFRHARLPVLFCSPTMELGVDIAELNVVNMRNVPPTPANYAQRSGRAGRSGQPAFIYTYCSAGSPHDQYFFRRPEAMVAGSVSSPRIELENEELIRAHVHAIWLSSSSVSLGQSLRDVLDVIGDDPTLEVQPQLAQRLADAGLRARAHDRVKDALGDVIAQVIAPGDTVDRWLDQVLRELPLSFERACERWRTLYRAALSQMERQSRIIRDASRESRDRDAARRLRAEAEAQRDLLIDDSGDQQSDFYSYRYFASEGFLPGYNFPRLPLSAFLPGRRRRRGNDDFLSRPRFLAISEFGPRSLVYHEGSRYVVNKVILPVDREDASIKRRAKICEACGYLHPLEDGPGPDLCESCHAPLDHEWPNLFRMQNVATRRRDRINSDEEERFRLGYELRTGVRFASRHGALSVRTAFLSDEANEEEPLVLLKYGAAATLWRMNLGWRRRKQKEIRGYLVDVERGYWAKSQEIEDDADGPDDPMSPRVERVVPYVEDTRNALIVRPRYGLTISQLASLESALKTAIQVLYQLEDREIGSEPLPSNTDRKTLLFYEASEGGAGVLRQLVEDPQALPRVARKALELLHFDPDTGADIAEPPGRERCEAACYECLLSYYNQRDHQVLDRHVIAPVLLDWSRRTAELAAGPLPRPEQLEQLLRAAQTELERTWIRLVDERGHRLPDFAQPLFEELRARPDFYYHEAEVAIFVDGPHHDEESQRTEDRQIEERLTNAGMSVIRFHHQAEWREILGRYTTVFGPASAIDDVASPGGSDVEHAPPPPAFDPDDFDDRWHDTLARLAQIEGVVITPGDEVMRGGRAIDLDLATITRGEHSVRLVDLATPNARAVMSALQEQGHRVVPLRADMPDIVERIIAALER
ncbi:MAG: DEAD/DEAH box helicase [Deltaproteobacteria bacterium]|nr:DEAD/DEAH box helicase [Kofleriaceae bacterium]